MAERRSDESTLEVDGHSRIKHFLEIYSRRDFTKTCSNFQAGSVIRSQAKHSAQVRRNFMFRNRVLIQFIFLDERNVTFRSS